MAEVLADAPAVPALPASTRPERLLAAASIAAAVVLLALTAIRIGSRADAWSWALPLAWLAGMAAADFASGLVHWGADTWGRDDLPIVGPRLLVPFRVHHVNPDDFLHRGFLDANGDVALLALLPLSGLFVMPLDTSAERLVAVFGVAFCGVGLFTNQIHQWAHQPRPPRAIRWLQRSGLILSRRAHAVHHQRPYDGRYCITTGWCNVPLEAIGFFRGLERVITRMTGHQPRSDDRAYEQRYGLLEGDRGPRPR